MLKRTSKCVSYAELAVLTAALLTRLSFYARYQHYSTTFTPHSSERQRERQRGLVKQTFELDVAATEPQDDQVANGHQSPSLELYLPHCIEIYIDCRVMPEIKRFRSFLNVIAGQRHQTAAETKSQQLMMGSYKRMSNTEIDIPGPLSRPPRINHIK